MIKWSYQCLARLALYKEFTYSSIKPFSLIGNLIIHCNGNPSEDMDMHVSA